MEQGYGGVLARSGLAAPARERITVAVLAALGWERQLHSHLRGAKRLGVSPRAIAGAYRAGVRSAGRAERSAAARAWRAAGAETRGRGRRRG